MKGKKQNITLQLAMLIVLIVLANLFSASIFRRIDLTAEKRFSLSDVSVDLFNNLPSRPLITIYYSGQMPTQYKLFEEAIETYLNELHISTDGAFEYEFVDPSGNDQLYKQFYDRGYYPFPVTEQLSPTEAKEYLLLPYGLINYQGNKIMFNLIKGCVYPTSSGNLDIAIEKAIQNFEYTLVTRMHTLTREKSRMVGLLRGHNEMPPEDCPDFMDALSTNYTLAEVSVKNGQSISPSVDVLLIMRPDSTFSERELYEIDQYVMRGGKAIWIFDHEIIDFDMGEQKSTLSQLRELNLDYMLLKYGVKVNYDIVQDVYCDQIDFMMNQPGFGPRMQKRPWVFHPAVERFPEHPISRNLDQVSIRFGASIDTNHIAGIKKEVILTSSSRSRTVQTSQFIDIDRYLREPPPKKLFDKGPFTFGVVLSGVLNSVYANRAAPTDSYAPDPPTALFLPKNVDYNEPKIAVISDGEFAAGALYRGKRGNSPYDNRAYLLNLIDYMTGEGVITKIRSKEVKIRMLDENVYRGAETFVQALNIGLPVVLVILFGWIRTVLRKRKNNQLKVE